MVSKSSAGLAGYIEHIGRRCAHFKGAAFVIIDVVPNIADHIDGQPAIRAAFINSQAASVQP